MNTALPANKFTWLVKREFWEYRGSFFWAPLITAMIMIAITLIGSDHGGSDRASARHQHQRFRPQQDRVIDERRQHREAGIRRWT